MIRLFTWNLFCVGRPKLFPIFCLASKAPYYFCILSCWRNNHKKSFSKIEYRNSTELSKYVWDLKEREREFTIQWSILKQANSYSSGGKSCNLCLQEKLSILNADKSNLLNKRREVFSKCVHKKRFLAGKFKRRNVHDLSRTQAVNRNQRHQLGTVNWTCNSSPEDRENMKLRVAT